jgi:tetratricopeptide (TPR) repeat protein
VQQERADRPASATDRRIAVARIASSLTLLGFLVGLVFTVLDANVAPTGSGSSFSDFGFVIAFLPFPIVAYVLTTRRPDNAVGWLMQGMGVGVLRDHGGSVAERLPDDQRLLELAEHNHMHSNVYYWTGVYERALELSERARALGGLEPRSAEFLLRGAGLRGLILSEMGRYEEALEAGDVAIEIARKRGRSDSVVMNYSTMPRREIFALDEARERSEILTDRLGPSDFNMPWINARADLLGAQLLMDDLAPVERTWPALWEDAVASEAWERWLVSGRLAANRADLELAAGRIDDAVTWSRRAIELAKRVGRRKYLANGLTTLGRALTARGDAASATAELRTAVALADELGSPLLRWQARAALSLAEREQKGGSNDAEIHAHEAVEIIRAVAKELSPEHATGYLAARPVVEALELVR